MSKKDRVYHNLQHWKTISKYDLWEYVNKGYYGKDTISAESVGRYLREFTRHTKLNIQGKPCYKVKDGVYSIERQGELSL